MTTLRRPGAVSLAVLVGLSASIATANVIAPQWSSRMGLDVWNLASVHDQLRQANENRVNVLAQEEQAFQRWETANHTAQKLIDGMPLVAAADELMIVFQSEEGTTITLNSIYPDAPTVRHRFALHAIERASRLIENNPLRRQAVVTRLKVEYATLHASPKFPADALK